MTYDGTSGLEKIFSLRSHWLPVVHLEQYLFVILPIHFNVPTDITIGKILFGQLYRLTVTAVAFLLNLEDTIPYKWPGHLSFTVFLLSLLQCSLSHKSVCMMCRMVGHSTVTYSVILTLWILCKSLHMLQMNIRWWEARRREMICVYVYVCMHTHMWVGMCTCICLIL